MFSCHPPCGDLVIAPSGHDSSPSALRPGWVTFLRLTGRQSLAAQLLLTSVLPGHFRFLRKHNDGYLTSPLMFKLPLVRWKALDRFLIQVSFDFKTFWRLYTVEIEHMKRRVTCGCDRSRRRQKVPSPEFGSRPRRDQSQLYFIRLLAG